MAIVEDYSAIAKRMRELGTATPKDAVEIIELEQWRDAAFGAASEYARQRRMETAQRRLPPRRTS